MSYFQKKPYKPYRKPEPRYSDGMGHFPEVRVVYTGDSKEAKDVALEKALAQLKKILVRDGVLQELKDRRYFKSDSQKEYERRRTREYKQSLKKDKKPRFYKD